MAQKAKPNASESAPHAGIVAPLDYDTDTYAAELADTDTDASPDGTTEASAAPEHNWDAMQPVIPMDSKTRPQQSHVDVVTEVPDRIRARVESQLCLNAERVRAAARSSAARPRVNYAWAVQRVSDAKMGEALVRHLLRYAKYRPALTDVPHIGVGSPTGQITIRVGQVAYYHITSDGDAVQCTEATEGAVCGVRFSARPFESRGSSARLPGTAR